MAGSGNVVGSTWEDLRDIIALVEDKDRVGVCIDTCHAFAAGHDLRTPEAFKRTFDSFDEIVGAKYLKAFHRKFQTKDHPNTFCITIPLTRSVNDSKAPLGSNRDLHANIGTGFLGLRAFHNVMNNDAFCGMPMVLETPIDRKDEKTGKMIEDKQVWADEIKLLESLIGMDPEGGEFRKLEEELQARGAAERKRIQEQVDKKAEKDAKKAEKDAKKAEKDAKKAERDAKKGTQKKKQEADN
jgi:AP endonuclease-1